MKNKKIIVGWILIAVQCLALFGSIASGGPNLTGIPNALGFFSFSIVGAILLIIGYFPKDDEESQETQESEESEKSE